MSGALARRLGLGGLLVLGLIVRLPGLGEPPLEYHPSRQYRAAIIARAMHSDDRVADAARDDLERFEPPLLERVASVGYALRGEESITMIRAISVAAWLAAAVLLYLLAATLVSSMAGFVAAAFFLFDAYGLPASRSMLPEPLLLCVSVLALLLIVRHRRHPSWYLLLGAGAAAGLAGFIKFPAVFFVVPPFVALTLLRGGVRALFDRQAIVFGALAVGPFAAWAVYGTFIADFFTESPDQGRFLPHLWARVSFWREWLERVDLVIGGVVFVSAIAAAVVFARRDAGAFLAGTAVGYLTYGLLFTYAIHTHDYYHLPVLPAVAIALGIGVDAVYRRLAGAALRVPASGALVVGAIALLASSLSYPRGADYRGYVRKFREVGREVDHSTRTIMLSEGDGNPLRYEGRVAGAQWPTRDDQHIDELSHQAVEPADRRLAGMRRARPADWFVVTDLAELGRQPELERVLAALPVTASGDGYTVWDLR